MTPFNIAIIGDSLTKDRNARNWPMHFEHLMQVGKSQRVRTHLFGQEGTASNVGLTQYGPILKLKPNVFVIAYINDANPGQLSLATSLANYNTMIDAMQAASPSTLIYVASISRPTGTAAAVSFPNIGGLQTQLAALVTSQSLAGFIDGYTAWGDPALNPTEYDPSDGIHPLLPGHQRVTLPLWASVFASQIT